MQKRLFLLAVALLILVPATGTITGIGSMTEAEIRAFESRNKTAITEDFAKWFTDGLGMRHFFLNAFSSTLLCLFDQSSDPHRVQIGQNNFLFLGDKSANTFSRHSGIASGDSGAPRLGEGFASLISLFQEKGIPVLIVIAPDKETVYGEYYPKWVKHVSPTLARDAFSYSPVLEQHVLFLSDILLKYKKHADLLYWKNDTHWNEMGAFLGYTAMMERIEELLHKKLERVHLLGWKTGSPRSGDLERFNRGAKKEDEVSVLLLTANTDKPKFKKSGGITTSTTANALNSINVAILHDSFYRTIPSIYRNTFNTVHEIDIGNLDKKILESLLELTPPLDLLIIFSVERHIPGRDRLVHSLVDTISDATP